LKKTSEVSKEMAAVRGMAWFDANVTVCVGARFRRTGVRSLVWFEAYSPSGPIDATKPACRSREAQAADMNLLRKLSRTSATKKKALGFRLRAFASSVSRESVVVLGSKP